MHLPFPAMSTTARRIDFTGKQEVSRLLRFLHDEFPISKSVYQVVKDTRDGLMEANVFTDDWPHFTTVVSQEFVPRLSEVADIRVFTNDKAKVLDVLNGAKLLENAGKRQFIFVVTKKGDKEGVVSYLQEALVQHSVVSEGRMSLEVRNMAVYSFEQPHPISPVVPTGYVIKDLLPEHMGRVAENYNLPNWYTELTPLEQKKEYVKELQRRFHVIGLFPVDNPTQPIAWTSRKSGGFHGVTYTVKEERGKSYSMILGAALIERVLSKRNGDVVMVENSFPNVLESIGDAHVLMLLDNKPAERQWNKL